MLFGIPYDARPSDSSDSDDQIIWRLGVAADVPGIDYRASFEVPVFKTADSRPDFALDESAIAPYAAPADPERAIRTAGVVRSVAPDGSARYVFPMARHVGTLLGLTLFTVVWTVALGVMLHFDAPIFFPIVFGLIDLVLVCVVVDLWFYRSVVDVSPRGVSLTAGLFGLGRTRWIDAVAIAAIESRQSMHAGNTVYYDIVLRLDGRKKLTPPSDFVADPTSTLSSANGKPSWTANRVAEPVP